MSYFFEKNNENSCYQLFSKLATFSDANESIDVTLSTIGDIYSATRVSIFEFTQDSFSNTYEWCLKETNSQIHKLKNEPISTLSIFYDYYKAGNHVIIDDIDSLKDEQPAVYAILKVQKLRCWAGFPISIGDELLGYLAIADYDCSFNEQAIELLNKILNILSLRLKNIELTQMNSFLSTHDRMTATFDMNVLNSDLSKVDLNKSIGILNADISNLNEINRTLGSKKGDDILYFWSSTLRFVFQKHKVYRIGGDKFLVLCEGISENDFNSMISEIRNIIKDYDYNINIGTAFCNAKESDNINNVLRMAEQELYKNKARYYEGIDVRSGLPRERRHIDALVAKKLNGDLFDSGKLKSFLLENYFDMDVFFKSMSMSNHLPYFGDMQKNVFFVSDPLCEMMGFPSSIVDDLLTEWKRFIPHDEDLALYEHDLSDILNNKREIHDLRYRVKDKYGEEFWIRCAGILKWNEDRTKPLFFTGGVTKLDKHFEIDVITNVPKEQLAIQKINEYLLNKESFSCIGFKLNSFDSINQLNGRKAANKLLRDIINQILSKYDSAMKLYRLDGLRFMTVIPSGRLTALDIANDIRNIAKDNYSEHKLSVRFPCAISVLDEGSVADTLQHIDTALEFLEEIMNLIEAAKNAPDRDMFIANSSTAVKKNKDRSKMIMDLCNDAIDDFRNFRTVIQPVVSAKTEKIVSGELLLRWKHCGEQNVPPVIFIPILEEKQLIIPVGRWIFEEAVCHCKRINMHNPNFHLNFNVSYHQIADDGFVDFMKETLKKWDLDGSKLVMELTETHANDDPTRLAEFVHECRKIGLKIALDDFGIGYSSLDLLLQFKSDVVKLDRSLVQSMKTSKEKYYFIKNIVEACHKFEKTVCVEGVETKDELEMVVAAGCDVVQGYYFYKPLEIIQVFELMTNA